jgi:hypothetical protein
VRQKKQPKQHDILKPGLSNCLLIYACRDTLLRLILWQNDRMNSRASGCGSSFLSALFDFQQIVGGRVVGLGSNVLFPFTFCWNERHNLASAHHDD